MPRRSLRFTLFITLTCLTIGYYGNTFVQPAGSGAPVEQQLAEFHRLVQRAFRSPNLEERLAALVAAIKKEPAIKLWPFQLPRERTRGELKAELGNIYQTRIRGDHAQNLERAIKAYEAALTVFTRETFPQDWAATQFSLGAAYWGRIRGDRAQNLERAIKAYEAILSIFTREAFSYEWANTQNSLGPAYIDRIRGDRAENQELALKSLEATLTVWTRESVPRDWAKTQNNLGNVYADRIRGDRAQNVELAIKASVDCGQRCEHGGDAQPETMVAPGPTWNASWDDQRV